MTDSDSLNRELNTETKVGLGILAGALAAAGLAAVYLYGTESGEAHRKQLSKRMKGVKKDVASELRKLQCVDKKIYVQVIDDVVNRYQQMDEVDAEELIALGKELKRHYAVIREEAEKKDTKKSSVRPKKKKVAKKTAKSVSTRKKKSSVVQKPGEEVV